MSESELIALTDDTDSNTIKTEYVDAAISSASAVINSYIAARYKTDFSQTPEIIKKIAVDMSVYFLESRRRAPSEERRKNYEDALRFLKDIAKGSASLDIPKLESVSKQEVSISSNSRIFTRDLMGDF